MTVFSRKKDIQLLVPASIFVFLFLSNFSSAGANGANVGGFVRDINDRPVKGTEIILSDRNGFYQQNIITNESGEYLFRNVSSGDYSIICIYNMVTYHQGHLVVNNNKNISINITIQWDVVNNTEPDSNDDKGKKASESEESAFNIILLLIVATIIIIILSLAIFSRIRRSNVLKHETRDRICTHINENPGEHFNAIKEELGLSTGVLSYHIERLEKERFISSRMEGKFKRFYPPFWDKPPEVHLSEVQEILLEQIKRRPGISQSDLGARIGRNRKVVNYQAHQLRELGFIDIEKEGRESKCYFVKDV